MMISHCVCNTSLMMSEWICHKTKEKPTTCTPQKEKEASIIIRGSKGIRWPAASESLQSQEQNFCSPADIKKFQQVTKSTI